MCPSLCVPAAKAPMSLCECAGSNNSNNFLEYAEKTFDVILI